MSRQPLILHPDRLFPPDPTTRGLAAELYNEVRSLPIISPHGHTDPRWFADNLAFADPVSLLITPDHYLTRMLYSQGIALEELGVVPTDGAPVAQSRPAWRTFARHYHLFRATPSGLWFDHVLAEVFGVGYRLDAETADEIYDQIADALSRPEYLPRALLDRFDIELLATTDSPLDDLGYHTRLVQEGFGGRILPTFRPDPVVDPTFEGFSDNLDRARRADRQRHQPVGRISRRAPRSPRLLHPTRRRRLRSRTSRRRPPPISLPGTASGSWTEPEPGR